MIYNMVHDAASACDSVVANGCDIVQPIGADAPEITARFRDPGGTSSASTRTAHSSPPTTPR